MHVDDLGAGQYRQLAGVAHPVRITDKQHRNPVPLRRLAGSGDDLARRPITTHGIDGDGQRDGCHRFS